MIPKPLAVAIVCLVTIVWLGNFAAQFLVAGYTADGWVHTIFLSVVGGALAISRKGGGSSPPDDDPPTAAAPDTPTAPPPPDPPSGPRHAALALLPWRTA